MITVKYFASLREAVGRDEDRVAPDGVAVVRDVWAAAVGDQARFERVLCAVNQEYARPDSSVRDGDEVAFFPPVTGG